MEKLQWKAVLAAIFASSYTTRKIMVTASPAATHTQNYP
jgi:hypothetical protein